MIKDTFIPAKYPWFTKYNVKRVELTIGDWKNLFSTYELNTLLCEAINHCINEGNMRAYGFLITHRKLYLIAKLNSESFSIAFTLLSDYLRNKCSLKINHNTQADWYQSIEEPGFSPVTNGPLFKYKKIDTELLVYLLLNIPVELRYSSKTLNSYIKLVTNNNFSSISYYKGFPGPINLSNIFKINLLK